MNRSGAQSGEASPAQPCSPPTGPSGAVPIRQGWWVLPVAGVILWAAGQAQTNPREERKMIDERLIEEIRQLGPAQDARLRALAERAETEARAAVRAAVEAWADPDAQLSERATLLLDELGELPIVPLLEAPGTIPPSRRAWLIETVVGAEVELRERVASRLEAMMDDKAAIPIAEPIGPVEVPPPPRRVCDEAYMQMRLLLSADEDMEAHYVNIAAFLDLSDEERDSEIERARTSRTFRQFQEP